MAKLPIRNKQIQAVKQYVSLLSLSLDHTGLLMDLKVPKPSLGHVSEFMSRRGSAYMAATGLLFPMSIPTWEKFMDTLEELAGPLELRPPLSIPYRRTSGRSWLLQLWAKYLHLRPSLDHIDWTSPLPFIVRWDRAPVVDGPTPHWAPQPRR